MINIVDSTMAHAKELTSNLREADRLEAIRFGLDPNKAVFQAYRKALYRKTAMLDGSVIAMWGVSGTPMSNIGLVYLITGNGITNITPMKFSRLYKKEVEIMNTLFPILENYVDSTYTGAVRMLKIAGFAIEPSIKINNNQFSRFSRGSI